MAMDGTDGLTAVHDFQSVIFDFDYTLADSSDAVIECANYALRRLGLPEAIDNAIRRTIGLSLPRTLTALAGEEHAGAGDEFQRLFTERADVVMHDLIVMYDFVSSITDVLMGSGIRLGIVSSKFRRRIERVLKRDDLEGRFEVIVGGEDVEELKPNPRGLLRAVDALSTPRERCLYVGDSVTDAETAQRAGVPFVAVLSGVTGREAFADYDSVNVLESAAELPGALGVGVGRQFHA